MVALNCKYADEDLKPKNTKFFCGDGLIKCLITSAEFSESRYATAAKPKPQVLKLSYVVTEGDYKGAENAMEFEINNTEYVDFGNGKGAPADQMAWQNLRALSIGCGFEKSVSDTEQLVKKFVLINHYVKKGPAIEQDDDYGNSKPVLDAAGKPTFYPDESEVARKGVKYARVLPSAAATPSAPATPAPAAPASPFAIPPATQPQPMAQPAPIMHQPQPAQPAQPAQAVLDDTIPF